MATLPTEILLQIFANLDYPTLKLAVQPVCRRFRAVINDASSNMLARALFLDRPATRSSHAKYMLHPCFSTLCIRELNPSSHDVPLEKGGRRIFSLENFGFYTSSGSFIRITDTSLLQDNATSPATDVLHFGHPDVGPCFKDQIHRGVNGGAVTVGDVLLVEGSLINSYMSWALCDISDHLNASIVLKDGKVYWKAEETKVEVIAEGMFKGIPSAEVAVWYVRRWPGEQGIQR